jgi:hypothetical protein
MCKARFSLLKKTRARTSIIHHLPAQKEKKGITSTKIRANKKIHQIDNMNPNPRHLH